MKPVKLFSGKPLLVLLSAYLLISLSVFAQEKKISKSRSLYSSKMELEDNIWPLITEAERLKEKDPTAAIANIEKALSMSIKDGNRSYEAHCYRVLGAINLQNGLNELALKNSQKSQQLFQEIKDENGFFRLRPQLAQAYYVNNHADEALKLFQEHVSKADASYNTDESVSARYKIAEIYVKQEKLSQALTVYNEILKIEEKRKNSSGIAEANKKIGETYQQQNKNEQALEYYNKAQTTNANNNDIKFQNKLNENISSLLRTAKKYNEEISIRKRSLEMSRENQDIETENLDNLALANTYLEIKQPEDALPHIQRSIVISDQLGSLDHKAEAMKYLSDAYKQQRLYEKAISAYQEYVEIKDSLIAEKERKSEQLITSNVSLAEKQKQIDLLEKDIEINRKAIEVLTSDQNAKEEKLVRQLVIIYALVAGLVIIVIASWLVYKNAQKRRIANQLLALKSLRSQMNPHFIFNALNSVNSFISKNDEKSANKYLSDFSKLMRMVMENSQNDFVALSGEINIIELYLGLEHFRFQEKFAYTFHVDPSIDKDAYEIPPMLIQPYIENAVWHGLRYKETKGSLHVAFRKHEDNSILVTIEDNGIGRKKSAELKTINQKTGTSTGIKNTVNRIAIINDLYKKNIEITITDMYPEQEDTGTRVHIKIPIKINHYNA